MSILKGRLIDWNTEHETGLIAIDNGDDQVRFRFTDYIAQDYQPLLGEQVSFTLKPGKNGHLWAVGVKPHGLTFGSFRLNRLTVDAVALCLFPVGLSLIASVYSLLPLVLYIVLSATIITTVYQDHMKKTGIFSIPAWQLLVLEALGGWPGSLLIQRSLNHTCNEPKYSLYTRIIRYSHVTLWVLLMAAWLLL